MCVIIIQDEKQNKHKRGERDGRDKAENKWHGKGKGLMSFAEHRDNFVLYLRDTARFYDETADKVLVAQDLEEVESICGDVITKKEATMHIEIENEDCKYDCPDSSRLCSLCNASEGMPTDKAVKFLEHGAEMTEFINRVLANSHVSEDENCKCPLCHLGNDAKALLSKMGVRGF